MNINWTTKAEITYNEIISYLKLKWTKREIQKFDHKLNKVKESVKLNPHIYPGIEKNKNIRKAKISKQTSLFYLIENNTIYLLFFWNEYKNPETLEEVLSSY